MAQNTYSNQDIHVEAIFDDTNNVCIFSRVHLRDFNYRPKYYYEDEGNCEENHNPCEHGLNELSENPALSYENPFEEDFEIMKSMGLPTSFGNQKKYEKHKSYSYDYSNDEQDNDYAESVENYESHKENDYTKDYCDEFRDELNDGNFYNAYSELENKQVDSKLKAKIDADFEDYWALHGDTIILNSWAQKYKDHVSDEYWKIRENELKTIEKVSNQKSDQEKDTDESAVTTINDKLQSMTFSNENTDISADKLENSFIEDIIAFLDSERTEVKDIEMSFEVKNILSGNMLPNLDSVSRTDLLENVLKNIDASGATLSSRNKTQNEFGDDITAEAEIGENEIDPIFLPSENIPFVDPEFENFKDGHPDLLQEKMPNMFTCTVKDDSKEENVQNNELNEGAWSELWTVHSQEEYDYHYKLFSECYFKKNAISNKSYEGEHTVYEAFRCNFCGEYNCDFCISNDYGNIYADSTTCTDLFNALNSNLHCKKDGESFWDDFTIPILKDISVSINDINIPENIFSVDGELEEMNDSGEMPLNDSDSNGPPLELPIKVKRAHETESENEDPADCIKELGLVIRPTNALKIKKRKRRRHRKFRYGSKFVRTDVSDEKESTENYQENENAAVKDNEENCAVEDCESKESNVTKDEELVPDINIENDEVAIDDANPFQKDSALRKYWFQRYKLFSRFDEGIKLDEESWFSVTPESIARHIAERCASGIIIDAFCGAGGNAIQFAYKCFHVIAIDIDPKKIELAKHNATVYGVDDYIDFIVGDYLELAPSLKADAVFLSPPWGGPEYVKDAEYDISKIKPDIYKTFEVTKKITENIALFLPKNTVINQVVPLAGHGSGVEIEQNVFSKKVKTLTAYFGRFVKKEDNNDDFCS